MDHQPYESIKSHEVYSHLAWQPQFFYEHHLKFYNKRKELDRYLLLEITLETGRHHQIRSQLCALGHPIKGDLKYGAKRSNPDGSIDLHARALTVSHPISKERIEIIAPPPSKPEWNFVLSD